MREVVALEYRQRDWSSPQTLADRIGAVADRCIDENLGAIGVAGLLAGRFRPLAGEKAPAVLFGLRAESVEAVVAVGRIIAARGFSCIYGWTDGVGESKRRRISKLLAGHGLVAAWGADRCLLEVGPGRVREWFERADRNSEAGRPNIWMPSPNRLGRAVDGMILEEAGRHGVEMIWVPGDGINHIDEVGTGRMPVVLEGRCDDGTRSVDVLGRWARGDRLERGKIKMDDLKSRPQRWLRRFAGLR